MPDKKSLAKAKKDAREKKKAKTKEKKKTEVEAAKAKKRAKAKAAKAKKRAKAKAAKEKKRVEAKTMDQKKIEDRTAKNIKTFLQKKQTNKRKTALSNDSIAKKKQQKTENIAEIESKPDPKARVESDNSNIIWKLELIKL